MTIDFPFLYVMDCDRVKSINFYNVKIFYLHPILWNFPNFTTLKLYTMRSKES